jgi:hypothetical protein
MCEVNSRSPDFAGYEGWQLIDQSYVGQAVVVLVLEGDAG